MDIEAANNLINNYGEEELKEFMLKYRIESFKRGDFDFIVKGIDKDGNKATHVKMKKAFEILMSNKYKTFLYGGGAGCYPKGTEFFDGYKWKKIEDYKDGDKVLNYDPDTQKSELVYPLSYIDKEADQFYTIKNRRIDFTTSENHKHLLINHKNKKLVQKTTKELVIDHDRLICGNKKSIITSFNYQGKGIDVDEMDIRLRVAIMADAHLLPIVNGNKFRINIKKQRKKDRLDWLLKENNVEYKRFDKDDGFSQYYFYYKTNEKEFEDYWYDCDLKQKEIVCDEVLYWDGSIEKRKGNRIDQLRFSTTSKKSHNFVQFAYSSIGFSTSTYIDKREDRVNDLYSLRISKSNGIGIAVNSRVEAENTTQIIKQESDNQRMYCFEINTGFFVVRQKGEIFVSGNSGKSWTGCSWLLFMCLLYPKSRWFVARNEINKIVDSVYVTFIKVAEEYGFSDFKFNAVKNFIEFGNGSFINFVEIKRKPSDPEYTSLGSTEYTGGWIEEAGEIDERGASVIITRVGRHLNDRFILNGMKLKGIVFLTCNPSKNWLKQEYYDKWSRNDLLPNQYYLPALIEDNPFATQDYFDNLEELKRKDEFLYEKLRKGDWNFDNNPNRLCELEAIEHVFDNDHVAEGKTYLTADIARLGKDIAVIFIWKGWKVVEKVSYSVSKMTEIQTAIMLLRRKYKIPKNRCIADEDGIGGGIIDNTGILGFINIKTPLSEKGVTSGKMEKPNYRNISVQCGFHLADRVNDGDLWINCDLNKDEKERIKKELGQIITIPSDYGKLDLKRKSDIKKDISGSPDYLDALKMRVFFDLKKPKLNLKTTWS